MEWAGLNERAVVRMTRKGLAGKTLPEGRPEWAQGDCHRAAWGKTILGSVNNRCKGPEALASTCSGAIADWLTVDGHRLLNFH